MTMQSSKTAGLKALMAVSALTLLASAAAQAATVSGFKGTTQVDVCALNQCFRPPDTMGAVGTTQFLETTNGANTIYDKATGAIISRKSMTQFWTDIGQPGGANGDQRVLFDHYTNRWIAIGFGSTGNKINIGVSDTADAMGTWKSTQIVGAAIGVNGTLDYPTLAMDNKGVYIGTNNFNPGFGSTSLLVIPKTSLFGGAPSTAGMTNFTTPLAGTDRGFAIQAAVNWQGNPGNTVAVVADSRDFNAQVYYRVNGVNAPGATQTASQLIAGTGYNVAGAGRQPDGSRKVDTLSPRITGNAVQYNGNVYSAHTVQSAVGDFAEVRWNVVSATTGALVAQGQIGGGGFDYYEGSIAVNEFGQAVIGYNRSGFARTDGNGDGLADGNISFMARTFNVDGGGQLVQEGAELTLKVSLVSDYHCSSRVNPASCRERWGDYSAVTIDPTNHHNFFAIGEYAEEWAVLPNTGGLVRANWATYIANIGMVPEPETYALMALGLLAVAGVARRRKAA